MMDRLTKQLGRSPSRVVVFRALQLGDMLVTVPFFRALRRSFASAHVALVGLPWARQFVHRFNEYLDEFVEFSGHPQLPELSASVGEFSDFVNQIRKVPADVAIQLHGSGAISNGIVRLFGARIVCGFHEGAPSCHKSEMFAPYPSGNEVVRNLKLLEFLGLPSCGEHLEFPIFDADWGALDALRQTFGIARDYVCIHPGARFPSRRWAPERFAAVADRLFEAGFQIVLTGSSDERAIVAEVGRHMSRPHHNLAGETTLGAFAALLQRARLLVTNDTGASHVAAAVGLKSVVIVLGSDPERWAPLNRHRHALVCQPIECRPCDHRHCPIGHPCATSLAVERVLDVAFQQLAVDREGAHHGLPFSGSTAAPRHLEIRRNTSKTSKIST